MKFDTLYQQCLALWPDEVEIYDGERNEFDHNDISFVRLSLTYDRVAAEAIEFGEWYDLMTWVIFKNLHAMAKVGFKRKQATIITSAIDHAQVKADLVDNLKQPGYETMLAEFERYN